MSEDVHSPASPASPTDPASEAPAGLQRVVQGLSAYWAAQGCTLLPPCNLEISDAFLHPKTFFGLLGPRPWQGVTAQPVSRPRDGRRGRHPFRTSIHLQLQVALERSRPGDVRDQVLDSLAAVGLDTRRRHLRLDSMLWRHQAVGARGRGWRLTVDGIGIGRITFLERLADVAVGDDDSTRIDVTLGVEHLALALSGVDSVYRLPWQGGGDGALRYDQLRRTDEEEQSRYVEEVADVEHLRRRLDGLEAESASCLDAGLIRPGYERAVDCLAVLDVLEMRGDLGDGERQRRVRAIRELIARVGALYLARSGAAVPKAPVAETDDALRDEAEAEGAAESEKPADRTEMTAVPDKAAKHTKKSKTRSATTDDGGSPQEPAERAEKPAAENTKTQTEKSSAEKSQTKTQTKKSQTKKTQAQNKPAKKTTRSKTTRPKKTRPKKTQEKKATKKDADRDAESSDG